MTEPLKKENKSSKCLFLFAEKGKWGVNEYLKPLKPIYNGVGWYIDEKCHAQAEQISQQGNMRLMEWPLNGESFEELRRRNKREFIYEKSAKIRLSIEGLKATLGIYDIDIRDLAKGDQRLDLEKIPNGQKLIEYVEEYEHLQEQVKYAEDEEKISKMLPDRIPIVPIRDRIKSHKETLEKYRGKKYLGLCVKTIKEFNDKMLGLRKLILLAAAPNVGKTALTIQLAKEVLLTEPDACLVYVSLEMDEEEIFTRMNLYHSRLNFDTYVLGSQQIIDENERKIFFKEDELRKINGAEKTIEEIGDRIQIIDSSTCPNISSDIIIDYVERLKNHTGCSRAIVIIDYLQVWPLPPKSGFKSDIEADKWRIGEIKKIRDALNTINQDPVIVISEARKPSASDEAWGGDLSDVMGSARGTYTPDAVLLLSQLQPTQLKTLWGKMNMPELVYTDNGNEIEDAKETSNIKGFLAHHGIALCSLKMPKGRDGMKKFNILLTFHFHKNKFEPIDWLEIRRIASEEKNKRK